MCSIYPSDVRYDNILADYLFAEGSFKAAKAMYNKVFEKDSRLWPRGSLLHRAFCNSCRSPIKGTRLKCLQKGCENVDWCVSCNFMVKGTPGMEGYSESAISVPRDTVDNIYYWKRGHLHLD